MSEPTTLPPCPGCQRNDRVELLPDHDANGNPVKQPFCGRCNAWCSFLADVAKTTCRVTGTPKFTRAEKKTPQEKEQEAADVVSAQAAADVAAGVPNRPADVFPAQPPPEFYEAVGVVAPGADVDPTEAPVPKSRKKRQAKGDARKARREARIAADIARPYRPMSPDNEEETT